MTWFAEWFIGTDLLRLEYSKYWNIFVAFIAISIHLKTLNIICPQGSRLFSGNPRGSGPSAASEPGPGESRLVWITWVGTGPSTVGTCLVLPVAHQRWSPPPAPAQPLWGGEEGRSRSIRITNCSSNLLGWNSWWFSAVLVGIFSQNKSKGFSISHQSITQPIKEKQ